MNSIFDVDDVKIQLDTAFGNNSEIELLNIIKNNSFLLEPLYSRKYGIQPNFCEIPFGNELRCDFCWLNDNSDGPEWVIVEIEKPGMRLFTQKDEPSAELSHAIEQVRSWQRYFDIYPHEKSKIFGAVSRFRWVLVAGDRDSWQQNKKAAQWRSYFNKEGNIEIRSLDFFYDAVDDYKKHKNHFWSFEENPTSLSSKDLRKYKDEYLYVQTWSNRLR